MRERRRKTVSEVERGREGERGMERRIDTIEVEEYDDCFCLLLSP